MKKGLMTSLRRGTAMAAACILGAVLGIAAMTGEAQAESSVIDTQRTGNLVVCKIRDNDARITTGDGCVQAVEGKPMEGLEFSAVRIAGIVSASADSGTGTFFSGLDRGFLDLLSANGINISAEHAGGESLYTAEAVSEALLALNRKGGATPGEVQVNDFVRDHAGKTVLPKTDSTGTASVSGLPLGLYLVAETDVSGYLADLTDPEVNALTGSDEVVYNPSSPFLVSLPMTARDGTSWQYDVTVYPKNQTVNIPKYIVREQDGDTLQQSEDLEIGETVRQMIAASAPAVEPTITDAEGNRTIDRKYEAYRIRDVMQDGLALESSEEEITVSLGSRIANPERLSDFADFEKLQMGTDYEVDISSDRTTFEIIFLETGLEKLSGRTVNSQVAVAFDCVLDSLASPKAGTGEAVTNRPELTWKNLNTEEASIKGNQPRVYTYRLLVRKKGLSDGTKAAFRVTSGGRDLSFSCESEGVYHLWDNARDTGKAVSEIRPSASGMLEIRGLDADRYTFTETATEAGHELMKSPFTVTLTGHEPPDGLLAEADLTADGKTAAIVIEQKAPGTASFSVGNFPAMVLRTGSSGLLPFEAAGMAILALAMALRRRGILKR